MKIITILILILIAILFAINETISFRYKKSKFKNLNPNFFDPKKAWKNTHNNKIYNLLFNFLTSFYKVLNQIIITLIIGLIILLWNENKEVNIYINLMYFLSLLIIWKIINKTFYKYLNN